MKTGLIIGIVVAVIVIIGGIILAVQMKGSYSGNQITPPVVPGMDSEAQTYNIEISNFAFSPANLNINIGDKIIWTNKDSAPHTVTSDSGSELASSTLSAGQTYSHIFSTAGTYNYHCTLHLSMKAKIVVE